MSTALLLDAGNSRLKWALQQGRQRLAAGTAAYATLTDLATVLAQHPRPDRILGCNVAGPGVAQALEQLLGQPVSWLRPAAAQAGLRNGYQQPAQLGADRWAAMLGARQHTACDAIVVMAGTAMTVDALTAEGSFLGGIIVPGYTLMRQALAQGTADLGLPDGEPADFPQTTGAAIVNGALLALVGAIGQLQQRLEAHTGRPACVLLSGGDAARLQPLLQTTLAGRLIAVDNLVLHGLALLADDNLAS